ncbi:MAG: DUF4080 domain-containing protein [Thermodesulfobacteriota bacterium]|nr:DUF4080 domain-containing protein [Thermodesulfobacteriota bacterium]
MTHLELSLKSDPKTFDSHKTRVLLIALNVPGYYSLPVRILSLLGCTDEKISEKFDIRFIEVYIDENLNELSQTVCSLMPDIIGLTVNIWNRNTCFKLAALLKKRLPQTAIVTGGQEVTRSVIDYLEMVPEIDYIIDGEGEIPFMQFLENWVPSTKKLQNPADVSGLHYRDNGKIKYTGTAQLIESLDDIPSPITSGLVPVNDKQKLGILLEGSRCCPFRCSFCFEGAKKDRVRTASVKRLIREIEYMAQRGAAYFHIMDPILCHNRPEHLKELTDFIKRLSCDKVKIHFSVEAYAESITDEVAECLSACSIIDIGLQTVNPSALKAIHRRYAPDKFRYGIERLRKKCDSFNLYLICGLPYETMATYLRGIRFVINEKPTRIFLNELCLLNGTELREKADEYGYQFDHDPPYTVYETKWISQGNLKIIQAASKALEKRYNLSNIGIYNKFPWISNVQRSSLKKYTVQLKGNCSLQCPGCHAFEASGAKNGTMLDLNMVSGCDVDIKMGNKIQKEKLIQMAGQLQLAGAVRVNLITPLETLTEPDFNKLLISRGIWHFKTFVKFSNEHLNTPPDMNMDKASQALNVLKDLSRSFDLKGKAMVHPFIEVVVIPKGIAVSEFRKMIEELVNINITMITIPSEKLINKKEWINEMTDIFKNVMTSRSWLKMPEIIVRRSIGSIEDADEIIRHFNELGLISKESCMPPCYQEEDGENEGLQVW